MKRYALSIRARLILLFTLQVFLIIILSGVYLNWRLQQTLERELSDKLSKLASSMALAIDPQLLLGLAPGDEESRTHRYLQNRLQTILTTTDVRRIYIFDRAHNSLVDTNDEIEIGGHYPFLGITDQEVDSVFAGIATTSPLFEGVDGRMYKSGFAAIGTSEFRPAVLAVEGSAETLQAITLMQRDLFILGLAVLVGSLALAALLSRQIVTPINRLKTAAENITRGEYENPVTIQGRDEVGFLGETMEEMRRAVVQRDTRQKAMLAGVAHEIRNPLGGIELFAGLLARKLKDKERRDQAERIKREVQNLKKVVNDFLDYGRPSRSKKEVVVIADVVHETKMLLAETLDGHDVYFDEKTPRMTLWIDRQHLKQILLNLLRNAGEAIPEKGGEIRVRAEADANHVEITVADNGPGIPIELREKVFEPFVSGRSAGTGLGLAIVQSLILENGGRIELMPSGPGAIFKITLPIHESSH